ncbi:unnamed protein product [Miscanthus lutarioriparius]|uniref:Uncharacterized protein n=1 Tax=Miscanthus lutarioriparius TaxID=422564 RepID=A0A811NRX7_9POAL|nr:unnamed protein product [Miscanthus lutarioriparius]
MASMSMSSLAFATAGTRAGAFPVRLPASALALAPRRRALVVREQSEDAEPTEETTTAATTSSSPSPAATTPTPKPKAKATIPGMWDTLAFHGQAPERINGRLAMVGFVSALAVEASRGGSLLS